ncbi:hypothetical protein PRCB_14580 [Pantoea rodasii]|uniref:Uncharacterized protein n=1 Tax=Pantoea rodasii TaxID=1076549 RepID=A0A2M9WAT5_9GAMM|nr:hypothetical protein PRCB_14580 [Pantoea rodasii]
MTICCQRCGCAKFYFTLPNTEENRNTPHHGACCAVCDKPIDWRDLIPAVRAFSEFAASRAE